MHVRAESTIARTFPVRRWEIRPPPEDSHERRRRGRAAFFSSHAERFADTCPGAGQLLMCAPDSHGEAMDEDTSDKLAVLFSRGIRHWWPTSIAGSSPTLMSW
jgi:hypothetical protein